MAVASLVIGLLWLAWIGSVLALIFGYIALAQIRQRNQGGHGIAIAGVVLGWVGVGTLIATIIAAIAISHANNYGALISLFVNY